MRKRVAVSPPHRFRQAGSERRSVLYELPNSHQNANRNSTITAPSLRGQPTADRAQGTEYSGPWPYSGPWKKLFRFVRLLIAELQKNTLGQNAIKGGKL